MSSTSAGSVYMDLRLNKGTFQKDVSGLGAFTKGMFQGMAQAAVTAFSVYAIGKFIKSSIELSSKLAEVQNVVDVTFGQSATKINDFAQSASKAYGLSEYAAKKYTGVAGSMYKSMGFGADSASTMSIEMAKMAGDFASFYDLDTDAAFEKIRSGISGETEPLKQLGINLSVANLEAYAMKKGITQAYGAMSQQNQALLRYNYLLDSTKDAQGDFSRTSGSWANQTRLMRLQWDSFKSSMGNAFRMILTPIILMINAIIPRLNAMATSFSNFVAAVSGKSAPVTTASVAVAAIGEEATTSAAATESAAKRMKRSLMGFDEINVLTKKPGTGGAAGSSASAAPVATTTTAPVNTQESTSLISVNSALWSGYFETIKATVMSFVESAKIGFQIVSTVFTGAWDNGGKYLFDKIVAFGVKLIEFAGFINTQYIIPLQVWFRDNLAPVIGVALGVVLKVVGDVFSALTSGFKWLMSDGKPVLDTIVLVVGSFGAAFLLVNGAIAAYNFIMGIGTVVTGIMTAASWALGAAIMFITSPIGLVIAAVAAVIAIGVLLYKNWGSISTFASSLWKNIQSIFGKIGTFIGGIWKGIVDGFVGVVNTVIGGVNTMIKGFLSPFNVLIKGWNDTIGKITGKIPTISIVIPTIPKFAGGGVIDSPTLGLMGEYAGAKSNREIVTPEKLLMEVMLETLKEFFGNLQLNGGDQPINIYLDGELIEEILNKRNGLRLQAANGRG
ncbi:MAG: hypothetical protein WBL80_09410 [Erysipelotrichaceae bacterium]